MKKKEGEGKRRQGKEDWTFVPLQKLLRAIGLSPLKDSSSTAPEFRYLQIRRYLLTNHTRAMRSYALDLV